MTSSNVDNGDFLQLIYETLTASRANYLKNVATTIKGGGGAWKKPPSEFMNKWLERVMGGGDRSLSNQFVAMTGTKETAEEKMRKAGMRLSGDYSGQYGNFGKLRSGYDVFGGQR